MNTIFASIPVGTRFTCNGQECIKRSTRTALMVSVDRVYYYARTDRVQIIGVK
jgi:hypothetical protein